jgi:hypothetical protein
MNTKNIMDRAIGLADLQNSGYITFEDKLYSLNESYRDVYEYVTKGDDDFFLKSATLDNTTIVVLDDNQYTIDLPTDFYKLRTITWDDNGTWREVPRFPINIRERITGFPSYRMQDGKIWVSGIATASASYPNLKIDYYPSAVDMTVPDAPLAYSALSIVPTSMAYTGVGRTIIYTTGSNIRAYSLDTLVDSLLYTSAGIADLGYLNGHIYFRKGGEVWRGSTDLVSTMVPAAITATAGAVVTTTLMWGYVYWSTATQCWRCNLDGTGPVLRQNVAINYVASWGIGIPNYGYINGAGTLIIDTGLSSGVAVSQIAGDNTYLYYRTPTGNVYRMLPTLVAGVYTSILLATDVAYMGVYGNHRLPIYTTDGKIYALSTYPPIDLTFNQNIAYEIMAYQCAIDFKRKNNSPPESIANLSTRLEALWSRFSSQRGADDYKPERIQNYYYNGASTWR